MANCFEDIANENLEACINSEIQAGVSEVGVYYAVHSQITTFPMPLNPGDVGYDFESAVTVASPIVFSAGKGFGRMTVQSDMGEVKVSAPGNKGNKKSKSSFDFYIPGNSKKLLGYIRTFKNIPMVFIVTERDGQKRLVGDKFNPAYMSEVEGTTGKGGEDNKGVQFTIEAFSLPIVYESTIQEPVVIP
ncbi:hypothetical protein G6N05_05350 [Flavobacterium sp. F372]|uniref:Phage tail protein n=1 Tax=Flavobacterium bernardetii TaxID=2813823 RepID=A0ABR7J157_9FLAO|nr:hypothetical protein [Flavobacterium bernardetii]MBC5835806.1 hypothetical protein [Flavobacterium bernardetii]NHF69537.1 hypothetical protein [Flavobacterium bernardetii]